jgi:hypothetical protein
MRYAWLTTTLLAASVGYATAQTPDVASEIKPGSGTVTDQSGNTWTINASGSIAENGAWTPGGGGTAALAIVNGTVYGLDAHGRGWFALSSNGQYWTSSPDPSGGTSATTQAIAPQLSGGNVTAQPTCSAQSAYGVLPVTNGGVGQLLDAQGKPFLAHGVGVMEGQEAAVGDLKARFPGINFVRYAIYDYASPDQLAPYVNSLTSAGIVVELEDHANGAGNAGGSRGTIFTGQALSTELAWYSAIAAAFKANPAVWFGTDNEPSEKTSSDPNAPNDPAALSAWQLSTYQAIRNAGNNSVVMLELNGWGDPASMGEGYTASAYSQMYNVVWDLHYYGWLTGYSTDQAKNDAFLAAAVQQAQTFTSSGGVKIPVFIGEYGNSTDGNTPDPNGSQAVAAVQNAALSGTVVGTAAWAWMQAPADGLLSGGGLSAYGQQVASYISQAPAPTAAASACSTSPNTVATATTPPEQTSDAQQATQAQTQAVTNAAVAAGDAQAAQDNASADAIVNQAQAILSQVPQQ